MIRPDRCLNAICLATALQKSNAPSRFGAEHGVPVVRVHLQEQLVADDPGVVHQDIDPAPFRQNRLDDALGGGRVGDVALVRLGGTPAAATSASRAFAASCCPCRRTRPSRLFRQRLHDRLADPPAAARHDRDLILERHLMPFRKPG